jgi:hypothetical protein
MLEGRGRRHAWEIDMSMENQIVPGSLADVLITLCGYFDANVSEPRRRAGPDVLRLHLRPPGVPRQLPRFQPHRKNGMAAERRRVGHDGTPVRCATSACSSCRRAAACYRRYFSTGIIEFTVDDNGTPVIDPDTLPPTFQFNHPDLSGR